MEQKKEAVAVVEYQGKRLSSTQFRKWVRTEVKEKKSELWLSLIKSQLQWAIFCLKFNIEMLYSNHKETEILNANFNCDNWAKAVLKKQKSRSEIKTNFLCRN